LTVPPATPAAISENRPVYPTRPHRSDPSSLTQCASLPGPFPVELLRFLEKATPQPSRPPDTEVRKPHASAALPNSETPNAGQPPIPDDPRALQLDTIAGQPFRLNQ
jgi:hypothetical protein